ncbi:cytochrome b5 [Lepidopterella palustris CBS 459.81]|uniref:Cytochrome b5 n=1 Tax=Lepidopterella palustris CBS 459.81 TaxID=1314670 RepID=A0A8E2JH03_9PEZI|nr:cytochrome b5 [Lepidopterella palustris CBS 459.81]
MSKEYTYSDVSEHATKKNLFVVIHEKVYNASTFIDEHPGGEEVLLDVAGQDATEAFEDVGHSDEAREILDTLLVGTLKRKEGDPKPKSYQSSTGTPATEAGMGVGLYAFILVGGLFAFGAYKYFQMQSENQ